MCSFLLEGTKSIPALESFIEKNQVKEFTVVADAAMISADNVRQLTQKNINYIVGALLGNISAKLLEKNKKLLGIKGYYTNLEKSVIDNKTVIERYHELYKIEQAFRISKSDLQTRPIFHFKEQPIKLHILICFVALVVSKHIELQTGMSIKKFIDYSKKIVDGLILNTITNKIVTV